MIVGGALSSVKQSFGRGTVRSVLGAFKIGRNKTLLTSIVPMHIVLQAARRFEKQDTSAVAIGSVAELANLKEAAANSLPETFKKLP